MEGGNSARVVLHMGQEVSELVASELDHLRFDNTTENTLMIPILLQPMHLRTLALVGLRKLA